MAENDEPPEKQSRTTIRARFSAAAALELPDRRIRLLPEEPSDDDAGAETGIEIDFRRRLAGLRRLPRHERPHALRAAKEWRQLALKALREKRATARHARHLLRKLLRPTPG